MYEEEHVPEPNTFPIFSKQFIVPVLETEMRPYAVLDHSNKSKKQMEDFLYAFNKRIETEITYQKNLYDCSKLLEKYIDPTCEKSLSYISSAWKVDNEQRGHQAKELADSLRTEVVEPMSETLKEYTNIIKEAEKKFKKLNKDYTNLVENYRKAKDRFMENDTDLKENIIMKNSYKHRSEFTQDKKNRLITKTMEIIKEKTEFEKNYRTAVNQFNEIIEIYQREGVEMLNQLENCERHQIKLESDAIRKLIVCEVSMFKNVEYDLINISKQMEKMYGENDILAFKAEAEKIVSEEEKKDLSLKTVEFDKSYFTLSLKNVEEDYHQWLYSIKRNKNIRRVMEIRMKELTPENETINVEANNELKKEEEKKVDTDKEIETKEVNVVAVTTSSEWLSIPKEIFNPPPNPNSKYQKLIFEESLAEFLELSEIINSYWLNNVQLKNEVELKFRNLMKKNQLNRILAYLFIEEYRIEHRVLMKWEEFESAGELIKIMIQECEIAGDVFTLKGILALIFTFYSIFNAKSKRQMYQQSSIIQSEVWKRDDYWEASIFESSHEEMLNFNETASFNVQKGEIHSETLLRERNIIFSQLASYCHYMLMLGITSKNVRKIVGRYCRLYDMTEDQNKDLSRMISNTNKQIKELNAQNNNNIEVPANDNTSV